VLNIYREKCFKKKKKKKRKKEKEKEGYNSPTPLNAQTLCNQISLFWY
jgi:hypothetical protein